jgi:TatD DNase family protein
MKDWVDAHCHLADPRIEDVHAVIAQAKAQGITTFLQGGVDPADWQRQRELAATEPGIWLAFGLHPYFVADHTDDECESALDQLARELPRARALGETGLDFRPHIMKDSRDRQIGCFEAQLELARVAQKPVILHLVRAFEESLAVLDHFGQGVPGMIHAFNGSWPRAKAYLDRGYLISVGGPVCRPDNQRLHQAVKEIPLEFLLLETDSPDQPPPGIEPEHNRPTTLLRVAARVAEIKGLEPAQILDKSRENLADRLKWKS